jgi:hypothetical protein
MIQQGLLFMEITKKEFPNWLLPIPYQISGNQIQTSKESNQFSVEKIKCRVKLFSKFEMKLKCKVLGDDAIHFCLAKSKKRDVKLKGRKYTTENKILALAFYKQSRRAYSKLREFFALPTL